MKKIIIILIVLLTTGCYDYIELNDLSIISSIGIDYQNEEFILTYEVLNDLSNEENSISAYDVTSQGKSITEAFDNISTILNKTPYYYHLKAVIIDENIASDYLNEITDYFIRNPKIIHSFYLVMCKDITAKDFLNIKNENHLVIGNEIIKKMENSSYDYSNLYNELFEDVIERLLNKRKDAILSTFIINDNNIETYGISLFNDSKLVITLDKEKSSFLNLLLNKDSNLTLENDDLIINIYSNRTSYIINNDELVIKLNSEAQIIENKKRNNLKKDESYITFNQDFSSILEHKLNDLISEINALKVDPLCISWKSFQKYGKDININKISIDVDLKVNKKGLIFEANYE